MEDAWFGVARRSSLRMTFHNAHGAFTAPLLHFQRPTARFDEPALFASAEMRQGVTDKIDDPELRAAFTRRVLCATIQPTSTFMNAIREHVSIIQRAGGRSARIGPGYINGAACNPRVPIALMNIWRVRYNGFDWRCYTVPLDAGGDADRAATNSSAGIDPVPGFSTSILVPKRRARQVIRTTPAMRMGVHMPSKSRPKPSSSEHDEAVSKKKSDRCTDDLPFLPDLARILCQPWLFHGAPMWAKLQGRQALETNTGDGQTIARVL